MTVSTYSVASIIGYGLLLTLRDAAIPAAQSKKADQPPSDDLAPRKRAAATAAAAVVVQICNA